MTSNVLRTLVLLSLAGCGLASAASHTVRATPDNRFEPSDLTIQVGDSVTWTNDGGLHNVAAGDGSFRCAQGCDGSGGSGDPSSEPWSFTITFTTPDVVDYVCEVHVGIGMVGRVEVEAAEPPPPPPEPEQGSLRLATDAISAGEGDGSTSVTVRRVGGDDGQVSVDIRTEDGTAVGGSDYQPLSATLMWADGNDDPQTVPIDLLPDETVEGDETFDVVLSSPGGGATLGAVRRATVTVVDDDHEPTACVVDETTHCLRDGRFRVRIRWRDFEGGEGDGMRIDLTDDSGLFWFFGPKNAEILVKVLNACQLEGFESYWVFVASATNVQYELEVLDTASGQEQRYTNPLGRRAPAVADTEAFETCDL